MQLPLRFSSTLSTESMGIFSLIIVLLVQHLSTHKRMSPEGFSATTMGITQDVKPFLNFPAMFFSTSSFTFVVTFSRSAKGVRLGFCTSRVIFSTIGNLRF